MNPRLRTKDGRSWFECEYTAELINWNESIRDALALFGEARHLNIICSPTTTAATTPQKHGDD